jgi:conjugative relaxase-like TrwC/TraI family protein
MDRRRGHQARLEGEVEAARLEAMLTGRNPVDGEPLLGIRGVPVNRSVPGFDLTFSAPKPVSLLWVPTPKNRPFHLSLAASPPSGRPPAMRP